ncbi:MAG: acyltransferase [Candidatus Methylacidiphilales bacterium]|nr:acyltransferase [Candidatus Methylacidiphilales bacterium]
MPRPPLNPDAYSPWLNALRGAACLAVVLHHSHLLVEDSSHPILVFMAGLFDRGWLGVAAFFALSGFLITGIVERRTGDDRQAAAFCLDRALRIFPAYWVAWVFAVVLACLAAPFNGRGIPANWPARAPDILADLLLTGHWIGIQSPILVNWSLCYEIGFYLIAAAALLPLFAGAASRILYLAAITLVAHLLPRGSTALLDLWPQFAAGCAARLALQSHLACRLRQAALAYPFGLLLFSLFFGQAAHAVAAASALLMVLVVRFGTSWPRPPRLLAALGTISYSVYLVHLPVMSPAHNLAHRYISTNSPSYLFFWLGHVLLGLAAGWCFFRLVERPLENFRHRLQGKTPRQIHSD